ncbi:MAG TPA: hypothetical protein VFC18_04095 [Burkholderiales bacterium]|nr:hypothetical protein [Burkholderiales bacterium]
MDSTSTPALVAAILNDWFMVRHYVRGARTGISRTERRQAIQKLGLTVRYAFSTSDDFEPLLAAVVAGGNPKDDPPF